LLGAVMFPALSIALRTNVFGPSTP
jgi:hypothetical protein